MPPPGAAARRGTIAAALQQRDEAITSLDLLDLLDLAACMVRRARLREIKPDQGDSPLRSACAKIKLKSSGPENFSPATLAELGKAQVEIVRG